MFDVVAEFIREDPGHVGFGSGFNQFRLLLRRCHGVHGDDEGIVASESIYDGCLVGVVDLFDLATLRDFVGAVCTGEGCDFVFS